MSRTWTWLLVFACGCVATPPREVVVRAGRLIDGSGAPAREQMRILIQDGTIASVEPDVGPLPSAASVIDATGLTVLPGLVDAHIHLFSGGACTPAVGVGPEQALDNLKAWLRGGVTTVADLGAPKAMALALRRHVGTARHRGPRLFVAGPMLTAPGGYPLDMLGTATLKIEMVVEIDSAAAARAAVQRLAADGVDLIKVALQEQSYAGQPLPVMKPVVLHALVDEAHRQELRVVAHAISAGGYAAALDAGVDVLGHVALDPLDDALLERLLGAGTSVLPTLQVFAAPLGGAPLLERLRRPGAGVALSSATLADLEHYVEQDARGGPLLPAFLLPGIPRARAAEAVVRGRENVARMQAAGLALGLGTDSGPCLNPHGTVLRELERLAEAGIPPLALLALASRGGARALNLHDALGLLHPGFRADLIAVAGNPDQELEALTRVRLVMIDGVVQEPANGVLDRTIGLARMIWAHL